ncbi:minor capsid protein [Canis familiaris papillomavirus 4]|uniref:Minor capsid protein L2 n=2 Tax=Canis familiaris papillomavirus 4 TaxID=464980 RepID=A9XNH6_9PAPI|nr:minor capsid protein [Canis familiaris papillomavirus 4]ABU86866.1 minor capsid protein [Canis familiaris papillomavirus 4]
MVRARRVPRASADDLYRTCKAAGTCPEDVINKIEGKTTADKILQYGGAAIFLGGLGIGTAGGKGGSTGYVPLGGRVGNAVTVGTGTRVVRPPVPVDAVGADILSVDALSPSVVALEESVVEIPRLGVDPARAPGIPEVPAGVPLDSSGVSSVDEGPAVITVAATIEPVPSHPPVRTSVTWSQYSNPAFDVVPGSDNALGETSSSSNIWITHRNGGSSIGEEIPLQVFRTSTPRDTPPRFEAPRRGGYPARFIEKVPVQDPRFLTSPGGLVQFDYDNPAFDPLEDSVLFGRPEPGEVLAAPDPAFQDVRSLGAPRFSETDSGHVRVTRLGVRGTMTTRSGVQLGSQAHFYHDISSITEGEWIELTGMGEHSTTTVLVSGDSANMEVVDLDSSTVSLHTLSSDDLEAVLGGVEDLPAFEGLRLEFQRGRNRITLDLPLSARALPGPVDIGDSGVHVDYPAIDSGGIYGPYGPSPPVIIVDVARGPSSDYFLHPSLYATRRRRRRRRRKHI